MTEFRDIQGIMVLVSAKAAYMNVKWPVVHDFSYCWSEATTCLTFLDTIHEQLQKLREHQIVVGRLARHIRNCGLYLNNLDLFAARLPQISICENADNSADLLAWRVDVENRICQKFCDETTIEFRNVFSQG